MKLCKAKLHFYTPGQGCLVCQNIAVKAWQLKNKEQMAATKKQYAKLHASKIRETFDKWAKANPLTIKQYNKKYRQKLNTKLNKNLRTRIYKLVKGFVKAGSAIKDLGCSVTELRIHLESKFQPGMTWDNYGQWHIDHIFPLSKADLSNRDDFLKVNHYSNLQPLWAADNIRKGAKC